MTTTLTLCPECDNYDSCSLHKAAPAMLALLLELTPAVPDRDAMCHRGICSQAECLNCQRITRAHAVIAKAEGRA